MADDKKIIFSMVGVNKIFPPQKQVLKNIYLSFFYGAKIGIIGLNGSGKSTLLKIIAGIDKDYQGEVVFSPDDSRPAVCRGRRFELHSLWDAVALLRICQPGPRRYHVVGCGRLLAASRQVPLDCLRARLFHDCRERRVYLL